ncbi:MAG TPA: sigma-70 family RNA polymerase sigma factor [Pedobacter sp.]
MDLSSNSEFSGTASSNKRRAFELAFNEHWDALFRQAYRKVQSADEAKDLVQEVFLALWDNMEKLDMDDHLLPYLYAVLRNKILMQYKKDAVRLRYAMNITIKEEDYEPSSHHLMINKELQAIIDDEVNKMPPRMREVHLLQKEGNHSIKEIAERLNLSEQTIKNQLHTASNRLKLRLRIYDSSLSTIGLILSGIYTSIHR